VPSYDLVFPDRLIAHGGRIAETMRAGANARLRDRFRSLLAECGATGVDVVERFREDGRDLLYADDFHLFIEGHRLLAEAMVEPVAAALKAR
jgi:hypothetical protein